MVEVGEQRHSALRFQNKQAVKSSSVVVEWHREATHCHFFLCIVGHYCLHDGRFFVVAHHERLAVAVGNESRLHYGMVVNGAFRSGLKSLNIKVGERSEAHADVVSGRAAMHMTVCPYCLLRLA